KNFILRTNQDTNDPTLFSNPFIQFKIRTREIYNRIIFKNFVKEITYSQLPKDKSIILFTLHKQPEASIDVLGRYYDDQLQLIKNIWRFMPDGCQLLVKEHSNAIGDRNIAFYRAVKKLRNTYLISTKTDSHKLLNDVIAVFTISGTIAYEAGLIEKHAFTFAPAFFNKLQYCTKLSLEDFRNKAFKDLIITKETGMNVSEFSDWLLNNSFEGILSDAFAEPRSITKENIELLSNAFLEITK